MQPFIKIRRIRRKYYLSTVNMKISLDTKVEQKWYDVLCLKKLINSLSKCEGFLMMVLLQRSRERDEIYKVFFCLCKRSI